MMDRDIMALMAFFEASDNTDHWFHKWDYHKLCNLTINNNNNNTENNTEVAYEYIPYGIQVSSKFIFSIDLSNNSISGTIPPSMSNLFTLTYLNLAGNSIYGTIDPLLCNWQYLTILQLGTNLLHGTLPPQCGNWTYLALFDITDNNISG